jgi:hypothetical protein
MRRRKALLFFGCFALASAGCVRAGNQLGTDCGGCASNQSCCDAVTQEDGDGGVRTLSETPQCVRRTTEGKFILTDGAVVMCFQKS